MTGGFAAGATELLQTGAFVGGQRAQRIFRAAGHRGPPGRWVPTGRSPRIHDAREYGNSHDKRPTRIVGVFDELRSGGGGRRREAPGIIRGWDAPGVARSRTE